MRKSTFTSKGEIEMKKNPCCLLLFFLIMVFQIQSASQGIVPEKPYASFVINSNFPTSVIVGESFTVSVTFANLGENIWTRADGYKLGVVDDSDPFRLPSGDVRVWLPEGVSIPKYSLYTFEFTLIAPSEPNVYTTDWRMIREGVCWFGRTFTHQIEVKPVPSHSAVVENINIPSTMNCGASYPASIIMRNTGSHVWSASTGCKLGMVGDSDPFFPAGTDPRIYLPEGIVIHPNETFEFRFELKAPLEPDTYYTDWRMVQDGGAGWFGEIASRYVSVVSAPPGFSNLRKKIIMGYQGWFRCPGDGSGMRPWDHWLDFNGGLDKYTPVVDFLPDLTEFDADEKYEMPEYYKNQYGESIYLYSAENYKSVRRHFQWMQQYGIEGVFLTRFLKAVSWETEIVKNSINRVRQNVKAAAAETGRLWTLTYDLSGAEYYPIDEMIFKIKEDWMNLVNEGGGGIGNIVHNGKPVLELWGLFPCRFWSDELSVRTEMKNKIIGLIDWFSRDADPIYQATLVGGVEWLWRARAIENNLSGNGPGESKEWYSEWLQEIYSKFPIIRPWSVPYAGYYTDRFFRDDLQFCTDHDIMLMSTVFPGFSWHNKHNCTQPLNDFPRDGGNTFWKQVYHAVTNGSESIFCAMFDEVDEGTAMFKMIPTQNKLPQPVECYSFVPLEENNIIYPSDWYLRIAGKAQELWANNSYFPITVPITPPSVSFQLITPNGGTYQLGGLCQINWETPDSDPVRIELLKSGQKVEPTLFDGQPTPSSYNWSIPSSLAVGNDYRIRITQGSSVDESDADFTITNQNTANIQVVSPNGNESWQAGTVHDVTWRESGLSGSVTVDLYKNGVLYQNIGAADASEGKVTWSIPASQPAGSDFKVRTYQGSVEDFSDISFSVAPKVSRVGSYLTGVNNACNVVVCGNYAYLLDYDCGMHIINIANPASPQFVSKYTCWDARDVAISGNYAFLADGFQKFVVLNLSNPSSPSVAATINTPGSARGIYVKGHYAYLADGGSGLQVIDIANPMAPVLAGTCDTPGMAQDVYVSGNYAYISDWGTGLQVINVSNPSSPVLAGSCDTPGYANGVFVNGNYAYIADWGSGLHIFNVSNPALPVLTGTLDTPGTAYNVHVTGNYAFVADGITHVQVVYVSNPAAPVLNYTYHTPDYTYGVYERAGYIYVADSARGGLQILQGSYPWLAVSAPNGGESWQAGSTQSITWTSSGAIGDAMLDLYKDGTFLQNVATVPVGSGTYSWTLSPGLLAGSDYRIRISQGTLRDDSENNFTVGASSTPSITVTSPNGGETWQLGSVHDIAWTQNAISGDVTVELYKGGVLTETIGAFPAANGTCNWTISTSLAEGNDYQIRVWQNTVSDYSDGNFSLAAGPSGYTITATAGTGGKIDPSGAVNVPAGVSQTFTITPLASHTILDVKVDGVSLGAISTYPFNNVTDDHTIEANFQIKTYTVTVDIRSWNDPNNGHGWILPEWTFYKVFTVNHDNTLNVSLYPDSGYVGDCYYVNGQQHAYPPNNQLSIPNITANKTIIVYFRLQ